MHSLTVVAESFLGEPFWVAADSGAFGPGLAIAIQDDRIPRI